MVKYFLKVAGTNVTQSLARKDLAGVISWKDKLPTGRQGELSPSKSKPERVLPASRAFSKGRGKKKNSHYLKLNAFSSKLFASCCLGSWALHECQCAEMIFPNDTFRFRQSTLWTQALLWKLSAYTEAISKLAKLAGTSWKLYQHAWVTLCEHSMLLWLLYAPQVQLIPPDLHQPKANTTLSTSLLLPEILSPSSG